MALTRSFTILLFCQITFSTILFGNIPTIDLRPDQESLSFSNQKIAYLIDTSKQLKIDEIRKNKELPVTFGNKIFSAQLQNLWLAYKLEIDSDDSFRNYIMQFGNAHIAEYELYIYDELGLIAKKRQGDNFPFSQREVRHNFFVHNLPSIAGSTLYIYIKINQEGQEVHMPIDIFGRAHFIQHTLNTKIGHGLVIGLFLITSIVTFILFIIYKEKFFLYEVVVSLGSIFYIIAEEGYGLMVFWPNHPSFNGSSRTLSVMIVIIFSLLFTVDFLKVSDQKKRFKYTAHTFILISILYIVLVHPIDLLNIRTEENIAVVIFLFLLIAFLDCVLIAGYAFISWIKEKNLDGLFVFLVFGATLFSVLIRLLATQGYGTSSELIRHTGFITRGIHIPLIGGYLIYTALKKFKEGQKAKIALLEQKAKTTQQIIEKIDSERQRVSMALHDSAGSIITGIKANLQMIKDEHNGIESDQHYNMTLKMSDQLQQEIRNISNDLLPSSITKLGLTSEIRKKLHHIENSFNLKTTFETNLEGKGSQDDKIVFHLYYIITEAIDNIIKYAEASEILVQYFEYDDEIHVLIEDNGNGFDYNKESRADGNGLKNMALRVSWLEGEIDVYSNKGTSISINIPIKN